MQLGQLIQQRVTTTELLPSKDFVHPARSTHSAQSTQTREITDTLLKIDSGNYKAIETLNVIRRQQEIQRQHFYEHSDWRLYGGGWGD